MRTTLSDARASNGLPVAVYVLAAGTFLMGTSEFVLAGLLSGISMDFELTTAQAGLTITVFAVGMIVGAPVMTILTLRMSRPLVLALALVTFALGHLVAAVTDQFGVLLGARLVTAIVTGAYWGIASAFASTVAGPRSNARALGVVLGGGMLANVLGVPLGAFLGQSIGWRGVFILLSVLSLGAAVAVFWLLPNRPDRSGHINTSVRAEVRALWSRRLWLTLTACALVTGSVLSIYSYVSPLLTERAGLPSSTVPLALLVFGLGAVVGTIIGGRLGDANPYRTALGASILTLGSILLLLILSNSPVGAVIAFAMLGVVGLSINPVLVALASKFGGAASTLATAMPTAVFNVGTALGTALAGALLNTLGPVGPVIVGAVGAAALLVPLGILRLLDSSVSTSPSARVDGDGAGQQPPESAENLSSTDFTP
jgi:predicted MFS family arabinose efflux permease